MLVHLTKLKFSLCETGNKKKKITNLHISLQKAKRAGSKKHVLLTTFLAAAYGHTLQSPGGSNSPRSFDSKGLKDFGMLLMSKVCPQTNTRRVWQTNRHHSHIRNWNVGYKLVYLFGVYWTQLLHHAAWWWSPWAWHRHGTRRNGNTESHPP